MSINLKKAIENLSRSLLELERNLIQSDYVIKFVQSLMAFVSVVGAISKIKPS